MSAPLPTTMRVIEIAAPGGPEMLRPATRPVPVPGPGEVLIRVAAAGVNRPDVFQRQGSYAPPPGASDIPGLEIAGQVWETGESVCALVQGGGYAEFCVAPAPLCLPFPQGFSPVEAAALPETVFTVWHNVFQRGRLQAGETLLVHGGTSGIGTTAIQLAAARGATVIATAGSDEKCGACHALGATVAINYRRDDFVAEVKKATQGKGADVILDMVGGDYIPRNLACLAAEGRLVFIAFLGGTEAKVNFGTVMLKRLTITGSTLRPQTVASKAAIAREVREAVWPLLDQGRIKPVIHATFPLEQAAEAHRLMESSSHIGKLILTL